MQAPRHLDHLTLIISPSLQSALPCSGTTCSSPTPSVSVLQCSWRVPPAGPLRPRPRCSTCTIVQRSAVSGQRSAVSGQRSARCSTGAAPAGESVLRGEWSAARAGTRDSPRPLSASCKLQVEVARRPLSERCSEGIRRCGSSVAPLACAVLQTVLSNGSFKRSACPPVTPSSTGTVPVTVLVTRTNHIPL